MKHNHHKDITKDAFLHAEGIMPADEGSMTPEQFCYWLQGHLEITNPKTIDERGTQQIKNHLARVFVKRTPALDYTAASNNYNYPPIDARNILTCDTGSEDTSIWGKYKDKLPSIFKQTIYRMPTQEEYEEVGRCKFLTAKDLVHGFTYTMVGRGVDSPENEKQIRDSLKTLVFMYPDNPVYNEALEILNTPDYLEHAKYHEKIFRTILDYKKVPNKGMSVEDLFNKYSTGNRHGVYTILDFKQVYPNGFKFSSEDIATLSGSGSEELFEFDDNGKLKRHKIISNWMS